MRTDFLETPESVVHDAVVVSSAPIKFDVTTAAIAEMQTRAAELTITSHEDKAGYDAVYRLRQTIKRQRGDVQKKRDDLKRAHIDYNRAVDAAANALIKPMSDIEDSLEIREKAYKTENERIAHEKMLFLQQRTEGRVNQLRAWGFGWNAKDETYDFHYDKTESPFSVFRINFDDIKELNDDDYSLEYEQAEEIVLNEQVRLSEIQAEKDAEAARLAAEQQAERDRIEAENKRLADERAQLQRQIDEQNAEIRRQNELLNAQILKNRTDALLAVGFYKEDGVTNHPGGNSYLSDKSILAFTDLQFGELIDETNEYHKRIIQEQINAQAAESERIRSEKQAEKERKLADKARIDRLRTDKKSLHKFFKEVAVPKVPQLFEPETCELAHDFCTRLAELTNEFKGKLEAL